MTEKFVICLIAFCFLGTVNYANSFYIESQSGQTPPRQVTTIRQNIATINAKTHWTVIRKKQFGKLKDTATATYYYNGIELQKINVRSSNGIYEYYLLNGELSSLSETYAEDGKRIDHTKKGDLQKDKSYFMKGHLFYKEEGADCGAPFENAYLKSEGKRINQDFKHLMRIADQSN